MPRVLSFEKRQKTLARIAEYMNEKYGAGTVRLTVMAKGAGMICPNMATMLCVALTDAKVGPDGRLYVLERSFSFLTGIRCRIRVFSLSDIRPGAVIDGETLLEASMSEEIDNMEGLAIWRTAGGETRISLISDDNRAFLQRTLYLEFRLGSP